MTSLKPAGFVWFQQQALLMICALALVSSCSADHGVHGSALVLKTSREIVHMEASHRDGSPFTGKAYGTFFGERAFDGIEWPGIFRNGRPDGAFVVFDGKGGQLQNITRVPGKRLPDQSDPANR